MLCKRLKISPAASAEQEYRRILMNPAQPLQPDLHRLLRIPFSAQIDPAFPFPNPENQFPVPGNLPAHFQIFFVILTFQKQLHKGRIPFSHSSYIFIPDFPTHLPSPSSPRPKDPRVPADHNPMYQPYIQYPSGWPLPDNPLTLPGHNFSAPHTLFLLSHRYSPVKNRCSTAVSSPPAPVLFLSHFRPYESDRTYRSGQSPGSVPTPVSPYKSLIFLFDRKQRYDICVPLQLYLLYSDFLSYIYCNKDNTPWLD